MVVLSDVVWLSGREGYRNSSVLCWDCLFGYGQRGHGGIPHFVIDWLAIERWCYGIWGYRQSSTKYEDADYQIPCRVLVMWDIWWFVGVQHIYQWAYGRGPLCWTHVMWKMWWIVGRLGVQLIMDRIVLDTTCQIVALSVLSYSYSCCIRILVASVSPWLPIRPIYTLFAVFPTRLNPKLTQER